MLETPEAKALLTIGDVANAERVPKHKVAYAVEVYEIEPAQRAGIIRLFDDAGVAAIRAALRRIASE